MQSIHLLLKPLQPLLTTLYGVESPYRLWSFALTACLFLCLIKPFRKTGGLGFCFILGAMGVFFGLRFAFNDFAPPEVKEKKPTHSRFSRFQ
jgi:hypothetical protein